MSFVSSSAIISVLSPCLDRYHHLISTTSHHARKWMYLEQPVSHRALWWSPAPHYSRSQPLGADAPLVAWSKAIGGVKGVEGSQWSCAAGTRAESHLWRFQPGLLEPLHKQPPTTKQSALVLSAQI